MRKIEDGQDKLLTAQEVANYRKMIARYFDVTRSQLLFSNGCLFIEGISECQLVETFSKLMGKSLVDHQIEIVDTDGTAFFQFLMLFNSAYLANVFIAPNVFLTSRNEIATPPFMSVFEKTLLASGSYSKTLK